MNGPTCPWPEPDDHRCRCKREVQHAHTCHDCLVELRQLLAEMPWVANQLEVSISRQHGAGTASGGASSGETALPWNEWASRCERRLQHSLRRWVTRCHDADVITTRSLTRDLPPGEPERWQILTMSRWLAARVDGLAWHPFTRALITDLTAAAEAAAKCVTWKRLGRVYLGSCDGTLPDPEATDQRSQPCEGEVYAEEDEDFGQCETCGRVYAVATRRAAMEAELDDKLYTATEIAGLAIMLGLEEPRDRIRNRIYQWHKRARIVASGHDAKGNPTFRYGEVRALLYREIATHSTPTEEAR